MNPAGSDAAGTAGDHDALVSARHDPERRRRDAYPGPGFDLPVFYGDLDPNVHVNNVALQRYFEHARISVHRTVDLHAALRAHGGRMLVARASVDFLAETLFGETVHVRVRIGHLGRSSFVEEQAAWVGERCIALCDIVAAYREDGVAARIPDGVRAVLARINEF